MCLNMITNTQQKTRKTETKTKKKQTKRTKEKIMTENDPMMTGQNEPAETITMDSAGWSIENQTKRVELIGWDCVTWSHFGQVVCRIPLTQNDSLEEVFSACRRYCHRSSRMTKQVRERQQLRHVARRRRRCTPCGAPATQPLVVKTPQRSGLFRVIFNAYFTVK